VFGGLRVSWEGLTHKETRSSVFWATGYGFILTQARFSFKNVCTLTGSLSGLTQKPNQDQVAQMSFKKNGVLGTLGSTSKKA
jgi:hypothetical protein